MTIKEKLQRMNSNRSKFEEGTLTVYWQTTKKQYIEKIEENQNCDENEKILEGPTREESDEIINKSKNRKLLGRTG